jgi:hypothetical protein
LPADSAAIGHVVKTALVASGHRPRRQLLDLLTTVGKLNPVMLQEGGEIADAVRPVIGNFAVHEHGLQTLLDGLLSMEPEHIVGNVGIVQQLLEN